MPRKQQHVENGNYWALAVSSARLPVTFLPRLPLFCMRPGRRKQTGSSWPKSVRLLLLSRTFVCLQVGMSAMLVLWVLINVCLSLSLSGLLWNYIPCSCNLDRQRWEPC